VTFNKPNIPYLRIIVATAKPLNVKLITKDTEIHSSAHVQLVW